MTRFNLNLKKNVSASIAQPKSPSRRSLSFKQEFKGSPIAYPRRSKILVGRTKIIKIPLNKAKKAQRPSSAIFDSFIRVKIKKKVETKNLHFNSENVRLWNVNNRVPGEDKLGGDIFLNFNLRFLNAVCKIVKQAFKDKDIELDLERLIEVFYGKTLNPLYHHLNKMIQGFACANLRRGQLGAKLNEVIFGKMTPILSDKMAKLRHLYTLLYLGLAIDMLLNDQPIHVSEYTYFVQNYIRSILSGKLPNKNNSFYKVIYERKIQFAVGKHLHSFTFCCAFAIFRIRTKTGVKTLVNLLSAYPLGDEKTLEFILWKNDTSLLTGKSLKEKKIGVKRRTEI